MISGTDINSYLGAVGWLVDRTSSNRQVLGSVWLVRSQIAITSTHVLVPYFDVPEALGVDLPHVGKRYAVKEILVHNYFDPWLAKRTYTQSTVYPNVSAAVDSNNLCALVLNTAPLEKGTVEKAARIMKRAMPEEESTLAGVATTVQITSIIQSLLSNRNQGTLTLFDARNYPVAKFFLKDNQLTHVKFATLVNEQALYKLLTSTIGGVEEEYQFTFVPDFEPEWTKYPPIAKSTAGLLMEAFGRMETYQTILKDFGNPHHVISQAVPNLNLDPVPYEMRPCIACTWNHIRHGLPLIRLLKSCPFDGATILNGLKYLYESAQIKVAEAPAFGNLEQSKLNIANNFSLERGTPISSICIDPDTHTPVIETGFVLENFPQKGDGHFIHSIGLPVTAAGSPLLAEGEVIGIHCGVLTEGMEAYSDWIHPSLYISAEHVYNCLDLSPQKKTAEVLAFTPANIGDRLTAGENVEEQFENATALGADGGKPLETGVPSLAPDMTSGWGRTSIAAETAPIGTDDNNSNHTGSGDHRPVNQFDTGSFKGKALVKKSGFLDSISGIFKTKGVAIENETVDVSLLRQGLDSDRFDSIKPGAGVRPGDLLRIRMKFLNNNYVAVLLKHSEDNLVRLVYPESPSHEEENAKGQTIEVPGQYTEATSVGRKKVYNGIPINTPNGHDEIIVITSASPLVVRLFELGVDRVFAFILKSLGEKENKGKFNVHRMDIVRAGPQDYESPNTLNACVLNLKHGD